MGSGGKEEEKKNRMGGSEVGRERTDSGGRGRQVLHQPLDRRPGDTCAPLR